MFRRILVANRGEIAARVIRACREMGIDTVAVHSTADAASPHLRLAGRSICIGPAQASRSYLDMDAVLQAAEQTECQAIHPGYGFLSENALFASRCAAHQITFIGPTPRLMRLMGDKVEARRTMRDAGLSTIPGSEGALAGPDEAIHMAAEVGYPVFLKASAGGGGKGMRRCADEKTLRLGFAEASNEAEKAFGNPALYLEKAIVGGRHIEFQVLADSWGHAIHLGERECSVQRHHQKLIEESPSPAVDRDTREMLGAQVARALETLGYRGAGTMEFLRDHDGRLYFMEMNTRLQVEHPITEAITGVDIVKEQIRIAANEPLRMTQHDVVCSGWALECRINAEDPDDDFRPSPGTITRFAPPAGLRVDSHIDEGDAGYKVPPWYDSLIAKVISHGADRAQAIAKMADGLRGFHIEGIKTTIPLHLRVLESPEFLAGDYDVGLLENMAAELNSLKER